MTLRTATLSLLLAAGLAAGPARAAGVARVGQPAPDFTLAVHGGGFETLSDHQGQVVLLMMIGYL